MVGAWVLFSAILCKAVLSQRIVIVVAIASLVDLV